MISTRKLPQRHPKAIDAPAGIRASRAAEAHRVIRLALRGIALARIARHFKLGQPSVVASIPLGRNPGLRRERLPNVCVPVRHSHRGRHIRRTGAPSQIQGPARVSKRLVDCIHLVTWSSKRNEELCIRKVVAVGKRHRLAPPLRRPLGLEVDHQTAGLVGPDAKLKLCQVVQGILPRASKSGRQHPHDPALCGLRPRRPPHKPGGVAPGLYGSREPKQKDCHHSSPACTTSSTRALTSSSIWGIVTSLPNSRRASVPPSSAHHHESTGASPYAVENSPSFLARASSA